MELRSAISSLIHLLYPHICLGCGTDILEDDHPICLRCLHELPHTEFASVTDNPIEKIFFGRIKLNAASSEFYFVKGNVIQAMIHELKYKRNKDIGLYLGRMMGKSIAEETTRFKGINALVPLPLFADKEKKRGYNQSLLICEGISEILKIPIISGNVIRQKATETQTLKRRKERWQNVESSFTVLNTEELQRTHVLLVDDVITTGATLEACASEILKVPDLTLSIATLAYATN
jgi:ComF family protein